MAHKLRVERTTSYTPQDAFGDDDNDSELLQSSDLHSDAATDDTFQLPPTHSQSKQLINASLPQVSTASYATGPSLAFKLREAVHKVPPTGYPLSRAPQLPDTDETDSEFGPPRPSLGARQSIRDVFKNALRESTDSSTKSRSRVMRSNTAPEHDEDLLDDDMDLASTDQAHLSDSSAPLSIPAANYHSLASKLDEPLDSTPVYRQSLRPKSSNQKLHQLLQNARAIGEETALGDSSSLRKHDNLYTDEIGDTTHKPNQDDFFDAFPQKLKNPEASEANTPSKLSSPPSTPSSRSESPEPHSNTLTPTANQAHARLKPKSRTPLKARDDLDDKTPSKTTQAMAFKTPRPPGGWSTPQTNDRRPLSDPTYLTTLTATPAPPGAWQATPAPLARTKGILKNAGNLGDVSKIKAPVKLASSIPELKNTSVNMVDAFGQPVDDPQPRQNEYLHDLSESPSKRKSSVRLVDDLGNALPSSDQDQSLDLDPQAVVGTIQSQVSDLVRDIAHVNLPPCPGLSSDYHTIKSSKESRYNELAMAARSARIEREKLKRQSHIVQSKGDEAVSNLQKFKSGISMTSPANILKHTRTASGLTRWLLVLILGFQLLVFWIALRLAQSYIHQYFSVTHYDPFIPNPVDTGNLHSMPIVPSLVPTSWQRFNPSHSPKLPSLSILNSSHIGKPLSHLMPSISWTPVTKSWPPS